MHLCYDISQSNSHGNVLLRVILGQNKVAQENVLKLQAEDAVNFTTNFNRIGFAYMLEFQVLASLYC